MSLSPILPGRLPGSMLAQRLAGQIQKAQAELARLQNQAATGQRIFRPGDDPAAAAHTVYLQGEIERNTQLIANVGTDQSLLSATENAAQSVADALNKAKGYVSAGIGDGATAAEKKAMAQEVDSLIKSVVSTGNSTFRGRALFGGAMTQGTPFELNANGQVVYRGDAAGIESHLGSSLLMANNADGATAFNALTTPIATDVNPALALSTRLADLHGGLGTPLGQIRVTVDDGVNPARTLTVDLAGAETVGDVKTRIEAAFGAGPPGLTVAMSGTNDGLQFTPSGGTVAVSDIGGGLTASRLGLSSGPAAVITGGDLNPALSLTTKLADLNGGTGVSLADGLRITSGDLTATIDLTGAVTVEDALNAIRSQSKAAGIELSVGLTEDRTGLAISSRVSGAGFSIGENGGTTAAGLGIRTMTGQTRLADLNRGLGVPVASPNKLQITRRSGAAISIDLSSASTVQDVLNAINAIDPGKLVASLNATGNGISLVDDDGVNSGPLVVASNALSQALGVAGTEAGNDPTVALVGSDVNPQESEGVLNLLVRLRDALAAGDDRELNRLGPLIDKEVGRFAEVRGDIAGRLQTLDDVENRLKDRDVTLRETLSKNFDADMADVLTQVTYLQSCLEATLKIGAQTMGLSLINYL